MMKPLVFAVLALSLSGVRADREEVNFDFAWRFKLGPAAGNATDPNYDDSTWQLVDQPHDMLIEGVYSPTQNQGQAYLPKNVSWYRKHFVIPADWQGSRIELYIEGAFSVAQTWFNGYFLGEHDCGYTSFYYRLDNVSNIVYGGQNVLAIYVDGTVYSGWWYEGAGLYRHSYLIKTAPVHFANNGVFPSTYLFGLYHPRATPAEGLTVDNATTTVSATLINDGAGRPAAAQAVFTLYAADGITAVATSQTPGVFTDLLTSKPCDGSDAAEVWTFSGSAQSAGQLQNKADGLCLVGQCAADGDCYALVLTDCNTTDPTQQWVYNPTTAQIISKITGLCLDLYAGTGPALGLFACKGVDITSNQAWNITSAGLIRSLSGDNVCAAAVLSNDGDQEQVQATLSLQLPELWSIARPYLYTLVSQIVVNGEVVDSVNVTVGLRSLHWDGETGFYVNEQPVKLRGFCNHNSFTAVGVAVPDRINLFRVQSLRGVGGNAWRTSHNPPVPALLDIGDRLGIAFMAENREFLVGPQYVQNMADLVTRDRNHPSVVVWSFCNEVGCGSGGTEPAYDFKYITNLNDGSRRVTGNMFQDQAFGTNMSFILDVQGFSHQDGEVFDTFHARFVDKPTVASECCSCETQRGEDSDLPHNASVVYFSNFNAGCVSSQTQVSNGREFAAGTFVWTLFDYYGEPGDWPHISSSFGSYDLAGFAKAPVWWYRSWWWGAVPTSDAGRPPVAGTSYFVRITEGWTAPAGGATTRQLHILSNAPSVQILVNGQASGGPQSMSAFGWVQVNVPYSAGNVTANALDASNNVVASHTAQTWGAAVAVRLRLDAPNANTGTGNAVFLDGEDVALVRAELIDSNGVVVRDSTTSVTFTVVSGPGLIWGTGNGDPASHEPNHAATRQAYHGLVRAVIRTTIDGATPDWHRKRRLEIDVDGPESPSGRVLPPGEQAPIEIVIQATAAGLTSASLSIPLSVDPADSVLSAAAASVASANVLD